MHRIPVCDTRLTEFSTNKTFVMSEEAREFSAMRSWLSSSVPLENVSTPQATRERNGTKSCKTTVFISAHEPRLDSFVKPKHKQVFDRMDCGLFYHVNTQIEVYIEGPSLCDDHRTKEGLLLFYGYLFSPYCRIHNEISP